MYLPRRGEVFEVKNEKKTYIVFSNIAPVHNRKPHMWRKIRTG